MRKFSEILSVVAIICLAGCIKQQTLKTTEEEIMKWDKDNTQFYLTISDDGLTLSWDKDVGAVWLGSQTTAKLKDGIFRWDFNIEAIADRQIGVGIMIEPPDWGFFGYLGAGRGAWAYDAYEGAIVTETKAVHSNLPKIFGSGIVSVVLDLKKKYSCTFIVNGKETPSISLPQGRTIIPAACLLKKGQKVRIEHSEKIE